MIENRMDGDPGSRRYPAAVHRIARVVASASICKEAMTESEEGDKERVEGM